jgi:hypothetical protein
MLDAISSDVLVRIARQRHAEPDFNARNDDIKLRKVSRIFSALSIETCLTLFDNGLESIRCQGIRRAKFLKATSVRVESLSGFIAVDTNLRDAIVFL